MQIPIPCCFGDTAICEGKLLPFIGVTWFEWTRGMEYTYFFRTKDKWHNTNFYTTFRDKQQGFFEIPDNLLADASIKDRGYPLKGRGYAYGVWYKDNKNYVEFIMTSNYFAHIKIQCDKKGVFVPGGDILFPPSWDTEKKERAILKSYLPELCVGERMPNLTMDSIKEGTGQQLRFA